MAWNRNSPTLAVGTAKGNLLVFNQKVCEALSRAAPTNPFPLSSLSLSPH